MFNDLSHVADFLALPVDITPIMVFFCLMVFFLIVRGLFGVCGVRSKYLDFATMTAIILCAVLCVSYIISGLAVDIINHMASVGAYSGGVAP